MTLLNRLDDTVPVRVNNYSAILERCINVDIWLSKNYYLKLKAVLVDVTAKYHLVYLL